MTPKAGGRRWDWMAGAILIGLVVAVAWRGLDGPGRARPKADDPALIKAKAAEIDRLTREAELAIEAGEVERAIASFKEVVSGDPNQANAWLRLGQIHLQQGKAEAAVPYLQKAAQLDPHNAAPHHGLRVAYRTLGRMEESEQARHAYEMRQTMFGATGGMGPAPPPEP